MLQEKSRPIRGKLHIRGKQVPIKLEVKGKSNYVIS